jgi:coenzyme F420-reducing hydrogenase beta subunit
VTTLFTEKEACCGCTSCMSVCPHRAIFMEEDCEGFLYPAIDSTKCTGCNLCKTVCTFQGSQNKEDESKEPKAYAVKHTSEEVRIQSTSGGVFTALSDELLSRGGIVYGACFDRNLTVRHQRAKDAKTRNAFRGSKYVQSDMRNILGAVADDLKEGLEVLFTGTPCQVAAVKTYMVHGSVDIKKLVLCDFICHGTPSPRLFSEYIKLCEKKRKKKVVDHIFRSKIYGWHNHTEINVFDDGEADCCSYYSQLFKSMYGSLMILRPSCHTCKYADIHRPSDITIADFWGIDKSMPAFNDDKGVSLVLLNNEKGTHLFERVKGKIIWMESTLQACAQPNLYKPSLKSEKREKFWEDYQEGGFELSIKRHFGYGILGDVKRVISKGLYKVNILKP